MWKQIFKSDYEISDRGEVRNILTKEIKRQYNHRSGYLQVSFVRACVVPQADTNGNISNKLKI